MKELQQNININSDYILNIETRIYERLSFDTRHNIEMKFEGNTTEY